MSYLSTKNPMDSIGSVIYQNNETEESFMESADRMGLQADAGVVSLKFLSREIFFRFLFTFGVCKIANETCTGK